MSSDPDLDFIAARLRHRRNTLQPEDVGLPRGRRRRTPGLRRDEVAAMSAISPGHYGRLERRCGQRPSPWVLARIARSLRFSQADRDALFTAAGYDPAVPGATHVAPGLMHVFDRLADVPALLVDEIGGVLHQTAAATVLFGEFAEADGTAAGTAACCVVHRELGVIELQRDVLCDGRARLIIYTAPPGSEASSKLELATVLGHERW